SLPYHLGVSGGSLHSLRAGTSGAPPATGVAVHARGRSHFLDHRCPFHASLQPAVDRTRPCAARPFRAGALPSPRSVATVLGRISPSVGAGGGKRAVARRSPPAADRAQPALPPPLRARRKDAPP